MSKKALIIIIVIIILLAGGGIALSKRGGGVTPTPTPETIEITEEVTEMPVEAEEVDLTEYSIKVLNGTAVAGLAAKAKTALEEAGFTVSATGNAATKDFTQVEIQAKETVPASVVAKLKTELEKEYTIGEEKTLDAEEEDAIIVTIGTTASATTAPAAAKPTTAAATPSVTATVTPTPTKAQ